MPALPGWAVRDTLGHVAGVCADVLSGRLDGAPGDEWTRRQVTERAGLSCDQVAAEWAANAQALLSRLAVDRRYTRTALDVWHHWFDVVGALHLPVVWVAPMVTLLVTEQVRVLTRRWPPELPTIAVVAPSGGWRIGGADPTVTVEADDFELVRALAGRRSPAQMSALRWSTDPGPWLRHLTMFTPAAAPQSV